ncbi:uncharacterized protein P884DRAFT_279911 [Thermothelomyces heterothallicus CBS 202.75]|uniref:uncharacterized protein n=1 Tax=Thermothelomyces heterothallicus CBS 202.75 TaxID=1149848 RepID=UPI0037430A3F
MVRVGLESFPGAGVPFEGIRHRVFDFVDELLVIFLVHVGLVVFKPHVGFVGHLGDEGFEVVENIGAELAQAARRVSQPSPQRRERCVSSRWFKVSKAEKQQLGPSPKLGMLRIDTLPEASSMSLV